MVFHAGEALSLKRFETTWIRQIRRNREMKLRKKKRERELNIEKEMMKLRNIKIVQGILQDDGGNVDENVTSPSVEGSKFNHIPPLHCLCVDAIYTCTTLVFISCHSRDINFENIFYFSVHSFILYRGER